jgi:hypothetical protein
MRELMVSVVKGKICVIYHAKDSYVGKNMRYEKVYIVVPADIYGGM